MSVPGVTLFHFMSSIRKLPFIVILAFVLALSTVSIGLAGSNLQPNGQAVLCVEGTVIDRQENALGAGWRIVATSLDDPNNTQEAVTDGQGYFRFEGNNGLTPGGWNFTIDLNGAPQPGYTEVTPASFDVVLQSDMSGCGIIRFKLQRLVRVVVIKIDQDHNRLPNWTIRAIPLAGTWAESQSAVTDGNGEAIFMLPSGNWRFEEEGPSGVMYTPLVPNVPYQDLTVEYQPDGYIIRFKNMLDDPEPLGCIIVNKNDQFVREDGTVETFGLTGWHIQIKRADGVVVAEGATDALGTIRFDNLPLGPYTVEEETRDGWVPLNNTTSIPITLTDSQCQEITFTNVQRHEDPFYCIEGRKVDENGKVGLPGFKITARPLDAGGYQPDPVFTDGFGQYRFDLPSNDYRIPKAFYEVCEELQDGWINVTPTCYETQIWPEGNMCEHVPDFVNRQVRSGVSAPVHSSSGTSQLPHTTPSSKSGCRYEHVVKAGESLYGIGAQYGVSPEDMLHANPFVHRQRHHYLYVGQTICIP